MSGPPERRAEGCTVVLCTASACCTPLTVPLLSSLRAVVRASSHAVLVTTGCRLGPLACRSRRSGPLLLVQPCTADRRPVGAAVLVGPVRDEADVAAVGEWLRDDRFDHGTLPSRLCAVQAMTRSAARN